MEKKNIKNVVFGKDVKVFDFVNLYDCKIDDNSKVGAFVEIQRNATIGKNCKISSHSFICEGVHINDKYPRSVNEAGALQDQADWKVVETIVRKGASIGSSSTILCGVIIGENAIVGAGSVVTKNVPADSIVAGVPAKVLRKI